MLDVATNYTAAFSKIDQGQLQGESTTINEIYYQILGQNELLKVQNKLKKQLDLKTSSTLPNLENDNAYQMFYDDSEDGTGLTSGSIVTDGNGYSNNYSNDYSNSYSDDYTSTDSDGNGNYNQDYNNQDNGYGTENNYDQNNNQETYEQYTPEDTNQYNYNGNY